MKRKEEKLKKREVGGRKVDSRVRGNDGGRGSDPASPSASPGATPGATPGQARGGSRPAARTRKPPVIEVSPRDAEDAKKPVPGGLTAKQWRFVLAYAGNSAQAARVCGYSVSYGRRLMMLPQIKSAIAARMAEVRESNRADRDERARFLSAVILDPREKMNHRLKACELLCRMDGDFRDGNVDGLPPFSIQVEMPPLPDGAAAAK